MIISDAIKRFDPYCLYNNLNLDYIITEIQPNNNLSNFLIILVNNSATSKIEINYDGYDSIIIDINNKSIKMPNKEMIERDNYKELIMTVSNIVSNYSYIFLDWIQSDNDYNITIRKSKAIENIEPIQVYCFEIIKLLEKESNLGVLLPPNNWHSSEFKNYVIDKKLCKLIKKMGLEVNQGIISDGSCFWCTSNMLSSALNHLLNNEEAATILSNNPKLIGYFMTNISKTNGKLTGTIHTVKQSTLETIQLRYMMKETMNKDILLSLKSKWRSDYYHLYGEGKPNKTIKREIMKRIR